MLRRTACVPLLLAALTARAEHLPSVASINLCTDQLVLSIAAPEQISSLSWLSADPRESILSTEASAYSLNFGTAEEILRAAPDVVIGGQYTSAFTRSMLENLGFHVVSVAPASSISDIERNLRLVAASIGREAYAETVIERMRERIERIELARGNRRVASIVVRPGGFTVGAGTLADELMQLAGLVNIAALNGLDIWGSLSLESLVTNKPELLIFTKYYGDAPSLANSIFTHPLVERMIAGTLTASIDAPLWACGVPESIRSAELLAAAVRSAKQ